MKMCLVMILVMKVFIFSKTMIICLLCPLLCGLFFFWKGAKGELSYKVKKNIKELREKYISNPPEGMTSEDIRHMSEDDLLDMDCFLNEDVFGDDFGDEGFYIF